jgi:predicted RNA-binding protein with PIN domain
VRLLIDGMNVIGSRPDGWWKDRNAAMARLVEQLERWAAGADDDVTVVFDRAPQPAVTSALIDVAHARRRGPDAGDDEIVRRLEADPDADDFLVVTSDKRLAERARAAGATVEPAAAFLARIGE